ncbi:hypothetical protein O1L68_09365 [Streptomyces lydicus]|nr:hypothetical protein [Streptomyces lydicus]
MTGLAPWVFLETGVVSLVLLFGTASVRLRTPSVRRRDGVVHDVWETAFLAGGPGRWWTPRSRGCTRTAGSPWAAWSGDRTPGLRP